MVFPCQICNINPSKSYLTKCCKLFICEQCKNNYETNSQACVCNKNILNKKLCTQNNLLHNIINEFEQKKPKQCDRCSEFAEIYCKNCNMIFCKTCEKQLHNAIGYSKHSRQAYIQKSRPLVQIIQKLKNKVQRCENHQQLIQFVCECGSYLCPACLKSHKQSCSKLPPKPKSLSEHQSQYYSHLLYKLSQITNYKQSLQSQQSEFVKYFQNQKEAYQLIQKSMCQQFESIRKMLQIKIEQSKVKLKQYWNQCQRVSTKTIYYLQHNMKKYDHYAKLIQKFAEYETGLDYLDKRIKRINPINCSSFIFKVNNIQQVKNSILSISNYQKTWQYKYHENIILNLQQPLIEQKKTNFQLMKKSDLLISNNNNIPSQQLFQASQNPLKPRILQFNSSHNQIQFYFLHLPYQDYKYQIQYGVGFRMKGKEIFKSILNQNGTGSIHGLNSSTKYRIRMKVVGGEFGDIYQVATLDPPKFYVEPGNILKITSESSFQFLKQGIIYGSNPIVFGIHYWTIVLNSQKGSYDQSQTACISVGISNKQKKPVFVGSTFNYGYQRDQIIVKIMVNCEEQTMLITSSQNIQSEEKFNNLPGNPIFPAIQNKSNASIHIKYSFGKEDI